MPTAAALGPRPDSFVSVVTDGLRVRSMPEVSGESVKYEPLLWKGALAWVIGGPVRGSGYDWYRIDPLGEVDVQYHPDPPPEGWVAAAGKDGEPWIADWGVPCPPTPLGNVSDFDYPPQGLLGLSCFGGRTLEFDAMASRWESNCDDGDSQRGLEPAWFGQCGYQYVLDGEGGFAPWERAPLLVTLAPEVEFDVSPALESGTWVRVRATGHYDDIRAQDCRSEGPVEHTVRACRSRFVVTKLAG